MASIRKIASGWQAQIARKGIRKSATFPTKREATDWAAREEHLILTGQGAHGPGTMRDLLERYDREVTPHRRTEASRRWTALKIGNLMEDPLAQIGIKDLRA